jgi:hypothetical protein
MTTTLSALQECRNILEHLVVTKTTMGKVDLTAAAGMFEQAVVAAPAICLTDVTEIFKVLNESGISLGDRERIAEITQAKYAQLILTGRSSRRAARAAPGPS